MTVDGGSVYPCFHISPGEAESSISVLSCRHISLWSSSYLFPLYFVNYHPESLIADVEVKVSKMRFKIDESGFQTHGAYEEKVAM